MRRLIDILNSFYEKKCVKKIDFVLTIFFTLVFSLIFSVFWILLFSSVITSKLTLILFIILFVMLIVVNAVFLFNKKMKILKVEGIIGAILLSINVYLLLSFVYMTKVPIIIYNNFKIFLIGIETIVLIYIMPKPRLKSIFTIISVISIIISSLVYVGGITYNKYLESIAIVNNENIDTNKYLAFKEDSNIARLPNGYELTQEEKFKYDDKLPIVDGAAAFFPMYSSFVEAMYPRNIGKLNQYESPYTYNNTPGGYMRLAIGEIDIMFGVYPSASQIREIEGNNRKLELIEYGKEAFVFFVNENNPVESLTIEEVKKIYSGEITNWKEVGGRNEEIKAFQRNKNSGSQTAMEKFMGDTPIIKAPQDYYYSTMMGIVKDVADYKNFRGAIGYSFLYYAKELVEDYDVKMLKIEGIEPNAYNIANGSYLLTEGIYMAVTERNENINKLINFVLSKKGQYLVKESGYTPLYEYDLIY